LPFYKYGVAPARIHALSKIFPAPTRISLVRTIALGAGSVQLVLTSGRAYIVWRSLAHLGKLCDLA